MYPTLIDTSGCRSQELRRDLEGLGGHRVRTGRSVRRNPTCRGCRVLGGRKDHTDPRSQGGPKDRRAIQDGGGSHSPRDRRPSLPTCGVYPRGRGGVRRGQGRRSGVEEILDRPSTTEPRWDPTRLRGLTGGVPRSPRLVTPTGVRSGGWRDRDTQVPDVSLAEVLVKGTHPHPPGSSRNDLPVPSLLGRTGCAEHPRVQGCRPRGGRDGVYCPSSSTDRRPRTGWSTRCVLPVVQY